MSEPGWVVTWVIDCQRLSKITSVALCYTAVLCINERGQLPLIQRRHEAMTSLLAAALSYMASCGALLDSTSTQTDLASTLCPQTTRCEVDNFKASLCSAQALCSPSTSSYLTAKSCRL